MQVIGTNGSYIGDYGYPRGYVARQDTNFNEFINLWQVPGNDMPGYLHINSTMKICRPTQRTANYSSDYPKLQVAPGSFVAARYEENGHVTQPWIPAGKPNETGTVWVFGTYEPSSTETLTNVLAWTSDGKGGDGKGWLMSAQSFDDGRCYQANDRPISVNRQMEFPLFRTDQPGVRAEQWCETDFQIPATAPVGSTLSLYWVWSWNTANYTVGAPCGKDEYYTACADVDVVDGGANLAKLAARPKVHSLDVVHQSPQSTAVSNYQSRSALTPTPIVTTQGTDGPVCTIPGSAAISSSVPASLTQPTSLPSSIPATMEKHPVLPGYSVPTSLTTAAAGSPPAANAGALATSAPAGASKTAGVYANSTAPASSASSSTVTISSTATVTSTSLMTSILSSSASTASQSSATQTISFVTVTITSLPSGSSSLPTAAPASAAAAVVGNADKVQEFGRRRHARGGW